MTYFEAIEDALARFPDMPVEMRQAFYTVLLVGDVTEEEAVESRILCERYTVLHQTTAILLPTAAPIRGNEALYTNCVMIYNMLLKR